MVKGMGLFGNAGKSDSKLRQEKVEYSKSREKSDEKSLKKIEKKVLTRQKWFGIISERAEETRQAKRTLTRKYSARKQSKQAK